jgi:hypothetical protein
MSRQFLKPGFDYGILENNSLEFLSPWNSYTMEEDRRYWVGGTGNWSDDENHWALTSGGSPGVGNLPNSSLNCVIDSNSGFGSGGTITMDVDGTCHDLTLNSGHSYSMSAGTHGLFFSGSASLESGASGFVIGFNGSTSETITTNSCSLDVFIVMGSGKLTLQDNLISGRIDIYLGTFDANDKNLSIYYVSVATYVGNITLIMGSGTWTISGYDNVWYALEDGDYTVTITPETSTIKFTDTSANTKYFYGAGKTYNNIWFTGTGSGQYNIIGENTFNDFKDDNSVAHTIAFPYNATTTVSNFTVSGSSGNLITLTNYYYYGSIDTCSINEAGTGYTAETEYWISGGSPSGAKIMVNSVDESGAITSFTLTNSGLPDPSNNQYVVGNDYQVQGGNNDAYIHIDTIYNNNQFILSKSSGTVSCDYLDLSNSNATGGATWYAGSHSNDTTNNTGWIFTDLPNINYTLDCSVTAYTLTGIDVILTKSLNLITSVTAYTLTGIDVILTKSLNLITSVTAYTLTGIDVILTKSLNLITSVTNYTVTGINAILTKSLNLITSVTDYTLTWVDIILSKWYNLFTSATSYVLTGIDIILKITLWTVHDNIKRNITLKKVLTNISLKKNKLEITTKKDKNLNIKVW